MNSYGDKMKYDYNKKDEIIYLYPENDYDCFRLGQLSQKVSHFVALHTNEDELNPCKVEKMEIKIDLLINNII